MVALSNFGGADQGTTVGRLLRKLANPAGEVRVPAGDCLTPQDNHTGVSEMHARAEITAPMKQDGSSAKLGITHRAKCIRQTEQPVRQRLPHT